MFIFIWPIKYIKPKVVRQSQYIASVEKKKWRQDIYNNNNNNNNNIAFCPKRVGVG